MDKNFDNNDFQITSALQKRNFKPREIQSTFFITPQTQSTPVIELKLKTENLDESIKSLKELAADIIMGKKSIPIGDVFRQQKCNKKMACMKCFTGDHGFSHPTATWITCHMLNTLYSVDCEYNKPNDEWDVSEGATFKYDPSMQNFSIVAEPRVTNKEKITNLFLKTIPDFFAGKIDMSRVGDLSSDEWCNKPFCTRILLGEPCNKIHSDEISFLTSLFRCLVDCKKVQTDRYTKNDNQDKVQRKTSKYVNKCTDKYDKNKERNKERKLNKTKKEDTVLSNKFDLLKDI